MVDFHLPWPPLKGVQHHPKLMFSYQRTKSLRTWGVIIGRERYGVMILCRSKRISF